MNSIAGNFLLKRAEFTLNVDFNLADNAVTAIYGRSGSGKTTFLRCIAGLEKKAQGKLVVNKEVWHDTSADLFLPTDKRPLGYVFQKAYLFSHLNVKDNLLYGYRRVKKNERHISFEQVVDLLSLSDFLHRAVQQLSVGESQRIAIARAFLTSPDLLLMDEPVSALDDESKQEFFACFKLLRETLKIPVLYVTHCRAELDQLADTVLLIKHGRFEPLL